MPVIAQLTQRTVSPTPGQFSVFSLALINSYPTAQSVTAVQPFVQVPAGVNTSLIGGATGQIIAQAPQLPAAIFPVTVPANSQVTIPFGLNFTTPVLGPAYQASALVQVADGTDAVAPGVPITPTNLGPANNLPPTWLTAVVPLGMEDFSSPVTSYIPFGL